MYPGEKRHPDVCSSINYLLKAVLSIDDDLVTPCVTLDSAVQVWMSNKNVLLGFSPRMTTYDIITGNPRRPYRWCMWPVHSYSPPYSISYLIP